MLLVIPVSVSDKHLAENAIRAFNAFHPGSNHDLLVVGSPNVRNEVNDLCSKLSGHFRSAKSQVFLTDSPLGWPMACNYYFQQTCYAVQQMLQPNDAWLYFELDTTPTKAGWLDALHQEYYDDVLIATHQGRTPCKFLGVKEPTIRGMEGELMPPEKAGYHMAAVGVYPAQIKEYVKILPSLSLNGSPFYQFIQWYTIKHLKHTGLIQNNQETVNYYIQDGEIVSESIARNAWDVHFNKPISQEALLVHGCKDGTLLNVLLNEKPSLVKQEPVKQPETPAVEATVVQEQPEAPRPISEPARADIEPTVTSSQPVNADLKAQCEEIIRRQEQQAEPKKPKAKRGRRAKRNRNFTPEQREAAAQRMRQMHIDRKAKQLAVTA